MGQLTIKIAYRRGTRVWCGGFSSLGNSVCQSRKDPPHHPHSILSFYFHCNLPVIKDFTPYLSYNDRRKAGGKVGCEGMERVDSVLFGRISCLSVTHS